MSQRRHRAGGLSDLGNDQESIGEGLHSQLGSSLHRGLVFHQGVGHGHLKRSPAGHHASYGDNTQGDGDGTRSHDRKPQRDVFCATGSSCAQSGAFTYNHRSSCKCMQIIIVSPGGLVR